MNKEINTSKLKSKSALIILIAIIVIIILVGLFIFKKKDDLNLKEQNGENIDNKNDKTSEVSEKVPNDSLIIDGVEYVDSSRNFKDVSTSNFSFFINNERTKYLTYTNNTGNADIQVTKI